MTATGYDVEREGVPSVRDYVSVLTRRRWVVLLAAVLIPLASLAFSSRQTRLYEASADVVVNRQDLAAAITGTSSTDKGDPDRLIETEATVARAPIVAERVLSALGIHDLTDQDLLSRSSVTGLARADIVRFAVADSKPDRAVRLATEYARQYTRYRQELDTSEIQRAREGLQVQIQALQESRSENASLYADLVSKDQQLRAAEALQTGNASLVRPANEVVTVQPRPVRNAVVGLSVGLVLGVLLAFLVDALDTRVRGHAEIV